MFEYEGKLQICNIFGKMDLEKVFLGDKRIACEFIRKCESED